ncbi:MAG: insulinase family protein [Armatimonadetes bacterium]|nr:insulinase family protein [Armatimonadota bacterium]
MPVLETTLDNGLTVLLSPSGVAPVLCCAVGYRVGARNERPGITGASHWVEHMTFNRTAALEKGDIFRRVSRCGGTNNGYTTPDFTLYYETLPAHRLELALHIESERMGRALFDPEETERERGVILAERSGSENSPHFQLSQKLSEAIYQQHSYRWPVIGTRPDLERLTRDELFAHYRSYYVPNNAVLALAGAFDPDAALEQVRRFFDALPSGPAPPATVPPEPLQTEERRVEVRRPGGAAYLTVCYRAPAFHAPDWRVLSVADAVLSGGKSYGGGGYMGRTARLYQALVEARLATAAGSSLRCSVDPSVFSAHLTLRPGADPDQAEQVLRETVAGLAGQPPSAAEMARAQVQSEAQDAYSRDGVTGQALALAFFQLLGHWSDLESHVRGFSSVPAGEVARVAEQYFLPENTTVGWFFPEEVPTA